MSGLLVSQRAALDELRKELMASAESLSAAQRDALECALAVLTWAGSVGMVNTHNIALALQGLMVPRLRDMDAGLPNLVRRLEVARGVERLPPVDCLCRESNGGDAVPGCPACDGTGVVAGVES